MKQIIAIYGVANAGKTSTLRLLIEHLSKICCDEVNLISCYDCKKAFKINGKSVCICTAGDNKRETKAALDYALEQDFDILIIATRNKGGSVNEVYKFKNEQDADLKWFRYPASNDLDNDLRSIVENAASEMLYRSIFLYIDKV